MLVILLVLRWSPKALLTHPLFYIAFLSSFNLLYILLCRQRNFFILFILFHYETSDLVTIQVRIVTISSLILISAYSGMIILRMLWYFNYHRIPGWLSTQVSHLFSLKCELLSHVGRREEARLGVGRDSHAVKTAVNRWLILRRLVALLGALTSFWTIKFHCYFVVIFWIARLSLNFFI
jgi:hypothetical protein